MKSGYTYFVIISLILIFSSNIAIALDKKADKAIKTFLSNQDSDQEHSESQGSAIADLNGDGISEIILVWTLLGPTYWNNTLTIFTKKASGYKTVTSLKLNGLAKLLSVQNGIIIIDQSTYAKGDPICCPSIDTQIKYKWTGSKIIELK